MNSKCTTQRRVLHRSWTPVLLVLASLLMPSQIGQAQPARTNPPAENATSNAASPGEQSLDPIARLRDEGTNRSHMAEIFGYLTDVIGPRLTGSPNCRRANDWTRDQLVSWGLTNAHLEAWGPFGRGWSVKRFSAQVVGPQAIPLVAWPQAWSHGSEWPIIGEVVYLDAKTEPDLDQFKDKLQGRIVLVSPPQEVSIHYEPLARRLSETNLLRLANARPSSPRRGGRRNEPARRTPARPRPSPRAVTNAPSLSVTNSPAPPAQTNQVAAPSDAKSNPPPERPPRPPRRVSSSSRLRFALREKAALIVLASRGDGGALSVGSAQVIPLSDGEEESVRRSRFMSAWATNAPAGPPQMVLAAEQYNRVVHMVEAGEKVKMAVEVQTQFHEEDLMCYNTIAEIPGTDLPEEIVMLGAHLDSMPGGTGATDNGAGVAVCMEAVRLLQVLDLKPRRTIRIALWTGEEQGLRGSRAYVSQHFGYYTNQPIVAPLRSPKEASQQPPGADEKKPSTRRRLIRHREYKRFSAYYNLDNGAGRIRGIYLQSNEALRPLFREWLGAFRDLGAETISASNTGGTDHLSFDGIGLPGFQFIQDPVEYWRSYHNSLDVRERAPLADLQQAAIIMAAFVYNTAMHDEKLTRKPVPEDSGRSR